MVQSSKRRLCKHHRCTKTNAGGGFCITHGGGRKCGWEGCTKGSQRGGYCRAHGGGSKCTFNGCNKVDAGGGFCRAHGGGKRCTYDGCKKADVGGGLCTVHGGGTRCSVEGCTKNDQGGGKCRAHGGGRRCSVNGCMKSVLGSGGKCSLHGGNHSCKIVGCRRIARGKHGFCNKHVEDIVNSQNSEEIKKEIKPISIPNEEQHPDQNLLQPISPITAESIMTSNVQCLLEGCGVSFGGECRCKYCKCCSSTNGNASLQQKSKAELIPSSDSTVSSSTPRKLDSLYRYQKISVQFSEALTASKINGYETHLKQLYGVDSVRSFPSRQGLKVYGQVDIQILLEKLNRKGTIASITSIESANCPRKEIVLSVPSMMCMKNCGNTIQNALMIIPGVESVRIAFDERLVVICGYVLPIWLTDQIESVGFEVKIVSVSKIPTEIWLELENRISLLSDRKHLKRCIEGINGVESTVFFCDKGQVLVMGDIQAQDLLTHLKDVGYNAHEIIKVSLESPSHVKASSAAFVSPPSSSFPSPPSSGTITPTNSCCSGRSNINSGTVQADLTEKDCSKYRTELAHTAALAVGWVVPGCAMAWGGECSCGDGCPCVGCPTHDPNHEKGPRKVPEIRRRMPIKS